MGVDEQVLYDLQMVNINRELWCSYNNIYFFQVMGTKINGL